MTRPRFSPMSRASREGGPAQETVDWVALEGFPGLRAASAYTGGLTVADHQLSKTNGQ